MDMNNGLISNTPQKIRAVGYCRYSSRRQDQSNSIAAQKRFITMFASQNNYEIIDFYCDKAKTGKNTNRPAFQQMLEDSKKGDFQAIIVHKLDRFSRNTEDTLRTIDLLKSYNVEVISAYERIENSPLGDFMLKIISGFAELYVANLSSEVRKGMLISAMRGQSCGGPGCLGYNIVNRKYIINEKEAESVRLIFQMYADGYGYNSILDKLNSLGYLSKAGKPFGKNSLYSILNNEKYIGNFVYNRIVGADSHNIRNSHRYKSDNDIIRIENGVPAIISKELWDRVQAIRKINPKGKSNNKYFYLLSGLIFCGECGYKMHGNPRNTGHSGPIYVTYRCNHKDNNRACCNREVRREYVESFVIEELFRHFFNENTIPHITQQLNEKLQEHNNSKDDEYMMYKNTLQACQKSRKNLLDAIKQTGFNKSIGDELKEVDNQIERCTAFLNECDQKRDSIESVTEEQVIQSLDQLKEFAKHSEREEVRSMIQNYVERVTVYHDRIEVIYKIAFPSGSNEPLTYNCDSSITRGNLEKFGSNRLFSEESQSLVDKLHTA